MSRAPITWHTHEYEHREKSRDWFLAVGIITVSAFVIAILFNNYILSILIVVGGTCLILFGNKEPKHLRFEINGAGVLIDKILYPFGTLHSFWVENNDHLELPSKLFVRSKKTFVPLINIPLIWEIDPEDVRAHLLAHLPEEEHHESFSHHIMEYLGF
ncbi:MAG: hypothetical protein WCG97_00715 [bacterium]